MTDGLLCLKCSGRTAVYNSRPKPNGTTERHRECLSCGFRFKTIEIVETDEMKSKKIADMLNLRKSGMTYKEIGKQFGISRQRVHQILKGSGSSQITDYFSQDITFCSNRECKNKRCNRNSCHIDWSIKPYHSFADYENTEYCPKKRGGL